MIYKLLKNLLKYAGYEGWANDEGFFVIVFTVFDLIRANGLFKLIIACLKLLKYPLFGSFDLDDLKQINLLIYIFHIEAFMSLCAS